MQDAVHDVLSEWRLPIWLTVSCCLSFAIYLRGWLKIRQTRQAQFPAHTLVCFLGGLLVLWLAIGSPMDGFADALLSAHMVEHLLLMSVVPPLLLFGLPAVPLLRGLPAPFVKLVVGPILRQPAIRRVALWLTHPPVAWFLMNGAFLAWHVPRAYDFALEHENWHVVEHLCFLTSALLFWWCLLRPWPAARHRAGWGMILYLVSADGVNTLLSAFLAFCGRPVYSFYLDQPNPFHVDPLQDQIWGAVFMWVFGSMAFLLPSVFITTRLLGGHRTDPSVRHV
jgi:putative membrane protein